MDRVGASKKIVKPEGKELEIYIRDGYFICKECGALMDMDDKDQLICPSCGYSVEHDVYDYDEYFDDSDEEPPFGCKACGGPYPQCKTSCKLFDD